MARFAIVLGSLLLASCSSHDGASPTSDASTSETSITAIAITPSWSTPRSNVSRRVFGHNTVWSRGGLGVWDDGKAALKDDVVALVKDLSPGLLRFPGGTRAMRWRFDQTIGPPPSRIAQCDAFKGVTDATSYGFDEMLRWSEALGVEVTLVSAWVDGSPEQTAAMVAYAKADASSKVKLGVDERGLDWKDAGYWGALRATNGHAAPYAQVKFLEVGNEPYLSLKVGPASSCGRPGAFEQDQRWVGDTAISTTAHDYASQVDKTGALVKAIDGTLLVGASAYATFDGKSDAAKEVGDVDRRLGSGDAWNARLVSEAGKSFDFFILHPYDFGGDATRLSLAERARKVVSDLRALDGGKQIAITEFGFLIGGDTLMNAIVSADMVRMAIEEKLLMSVRHILIEDDPTGPFANSAAILGAEHALQPGYHALRLLAKSLQNVAVSVDGMPSEVAMIATRNDDGSALGFAIVDRRSDTRGDELPTTLDVALPKGSFSVTTTTLHAESLTSEGASVSRDESTSSASGAFRITVPAHALLIATVKAK